MGYVCNALSPERRVRRPHFDDFLRQTVKASHLNDSIACGQREPKERYARMSAFGTKRTSQQRFLISAIGGKADIRRIAANVAKRPKLVRPVAHSEGGKDPGQRGDNRKCGDYRCDRDQIAIKLHDALGFLQLPLPRYHNKVLLFRNNLLPAGGGNAPLSRHSGDNLTQRSCHRSSPEIAATVR